MPGRKRGKGAGQGQGGSPGVRCRGASGPGAAGAGIGTEMADFCTCPSCGAKTPHERGIPCFQLKCPQCGKAMVRQ